MMMKIKDIKIMIIDTRKDLRCPTSLTVLKRSTSSS